MDPRQSIIETAFENRANINPTNASAEIKTTVNSIIADLDAGKIRVATRIGDTQNWETHQWLKMAVLLSFRLEDNHLMDDGVTRYFDMYHQNLPIILRPTLKLVVFA